jgi:hypothetical protein
MEAFFEGVYKNFLRALEMDEPLSFYVFEGNAILA